MSPRAEAGGAVGHGGGVGGAAWGVPARYAPFSVAKKTLSAYYGIVDNELPTNNPSHLAETN
jgi:hypothetical protein